MQKSFPKSTLGTNDDMYVNRIYRGASLISSQGQALKAGLG